MGHGPLIQSIVQSVVTMASVGIAAYVAVRLNVPRLRGERAFERTLDWCESMMIGVNSAGTAVMDATQGDDRDFEARDARWSDAIQIHEELIPLCALKEMYAPDNAVRTIKDFMAAFENPIDSHLKNHDDVGSAEEGKSCISKMRDAANCLAEIARGHLDIDRLAPDLAEAEGRFRGSFKARRHPSYP